MRLRTDLTPLPFRRKVLPVWVSGGTVSMTRPPRVGTSRSPPRAAVTKLMGMAQCRLSPSRAKMGCLRTRIST